MDAQSVHRSVMMRPESYIVSQRHSAVISSWTGPRLRHDVNYLISPTAMWGASRSWRNIHLSFGWGLISAYFSDKHTESCALRNTIQLPGTHRNRRLKSETRMQNRASSSASIFHCSRRGRPERLDEACDRNWEKDAGYRCQRSLGPSANTSSR